MKAFKWLFKFTGLSQIQIGVKILILLILGFILFKSVQGFNFAVDSISTKITHNSKEYKSLLEAKNNLDWAFTKLIVYSDSITIQKTSDSLSFVQQIKQHQTNELQLSKLNKSKSDTLKMYRTNGRACFIRESYGLFKNKFRDREIDCRELKLNPPNDEK